MTFAFPLKIHFKLVALAPRINIKDAADKEILYVEQKVFALKEAVKVFNNSEEKKLLYTLQADQIIDFGAQYHFRTDDKKDIGSIRQEGMKSIVQASYIVCNAKGKEVFKIKQTNPWIAVVDSLISIIPFAELLTGFILHPTYHITNLDDEKPILIMKKKASFLESEFEILSEDKTLNDETTLLLVLSLLMLVQLERQRS